MRRTPLRQAGMIALMNLGLLSASVAVAQTAKDVAKARHDKYEDLGAAFENIEKEAKKKSPDTAVAVRYAGEIEALGRESITWFPPGSGPGNGFKTKAKAEVWSKEEEFKQLHDKFMAEAVKLKEVAPTADKTTLEAQVHATGDACSECHKHFRQQGGIFSLFGG